MTAWPASAARCKELSAFCASLAGDLGAPHATATARQLEGEHGGHVLASAALHGQVQRRPALTKTPTTPPASRFILSMGLYKYVKLAIYIYR